MMMPANYSAIAENEMTYVVGGGLADILAPCLEVSNWQKFNTNMVTLIGNHYMEGYLNKTLGVLFSGEYSPKAGILAHYADRVTGIWGDNYGAYDRTTGWQKFKGGVRGALNVGLNVAGNAAVIYNLATGTVKNAAEGAKF